MEDYGLKVLKDFVDEKTKDRRDFRFTSANATYMVAREVTLVVNANPYVYIHRFGYVPKVIGFEILADHNRKLPYDDGTRTVDFAVTVNELKVRGVTNGTFRFLIFGQSIL